MGSRADVTAVVYVVTALLEPAEVEVSWKQAFQLEVGVEGSGGGFSLWKWISSDVEAAVMWKWEVSGSTPSNNVVVDC